MGDAMDALLAPFPVAIKRVGSGAGGAGERAVVVTRAVAAGELLLSSRAVGATMHRKHEPLLTYIALLLLLLPGATWSGAEV